MSEGVERMREKKGKSGEADSKGESDIGVGEKEKKKTDGKSE